MLTHRLHLDEVLAIVIALIFGRNAGLDITKAKISILFGNNLPDGKTADELEQEGILCIGEGGGRLDEHGKRYASDKCAALLMAEALGVEKHPALVTLLSEVCEFDRHPTATKTVLGTVIKNRFIARRKSVNEVIEWAIEGVRDAVLWFMSNGQMTIDHGAFSAVFGKAWQTASADGHWTDEMYDRAAHDFVASAENNQKLVTDLSYIYYYRVVVSGKEVADAWLYEAAYDAIVYQKRYFSARDEFLRNVRIEMTRALVDGEEVTIKVAAIRSDHDIMDKVYRSTQALKRFGKIDCLIQVKDSGNAAIFFNHASKLHSDDLARMLRWAEISLSGRKAHGWEKLAKPDVLFFVPAWYYHRTDKIGESAFYNGSLSHPHVRPTLIGPELLLELVCHAFHPEGVRRWRNRYQAYDDEPQGSRRTNHGTGHDQQRRQQIQNPVIPSDVKIKT